MDPQGLDHTQWLPLVGEYVEINWTDDAGDKQSAAGDLEGFDGDTDGTTWAVLDWGFGVDIEAKDFTLAKHEEER